MKVQKILPADAAFERLAGESGELYAGNVVDQRHGGPITIGYGRYGPHESFSADIAVHDVAIVLEGRLFVTSDAGSVEAGPGEMVYMPKGNHVTLSTRDEPTLTAYVTHPHWQEAEG